MSFRIIGRSVSVSSAIAVVSYSSVPAILVLPKIDLLAAVLDSLRSLGAESVQPS